MSEHPTSPTRPDLADDAQIERLVRGFYREAAVDDVLGPVFDAVGLDWSEHIGRVTAFWSWQLLGGRRYDGRPLRSHRRAAELVPFTEAHYERWLELFASTVEAGWQGPLAELAVARAHRMARSMRRVLSHLDDPDPTWPDESEDDGPHEVGATVEGAPSPAGVTMRVALGPRRAASVDPNPGPVGESERSDQ